MKSVWYVLCSISYYMGVVDGLATLEEILVTPDSLHLIILHVLLILNIPPPMPPPPPPKGTISTWRPDSKLMQYTCKYHTNTHIHLLYVPVEQLGGIQYIYTYIQHKTPIPSDKHYGTMKLIRASSKTS